MNTVRWGIIGCGRIARAFADDLRHLPDATLAAVASRTADKADAFADAFGAPRSFGSYRALIDAPDIDAVYIATPHTGHCPNTIRCLEAGKAVLCEKPLAVNATEVRRIIDTARRSGRFCMEAMWTRFLPVYDQLRRWLDEGAIGDPRMLRADFGFRADIAPRSRLFAPDLAGGAILDVGIYTLALAFSLFGRPSGQTGLATIGETGVDEQNAMLLQFPSGAIAILASAIRTATDHEAVIHGTDGRIRIPAFWNAREITIERNRSEPLTITPDFIGRGYHYEAAEVARCLRTGQCQSERMPLDESLAIAETMDRFRRDWSLPLGPELAVPPSR